MIRRLCGQRDCLNAALAAIPAGDILEVGLGNGRTYHHLRENAPDRRIWVIDREMKAHPASQPPDIDFLQGEAEAMLAELVARIGRKVAMVHYDLGIGLEENDGPLRAMSEPFFKQLLVPRGWLVANGPFPAFESLPLPATVSEGRYFLHTSA